MKKYSSRQLDQLLYNDFKEFEKIKITATNHQHDFNDVEAVKFSVDNDCYERVCCWCGKPKYSRTKKQNKRRN